MLNQMRIGLFVVARNGSSRLPKKHLLKFRNKKMIEILISRVLKTKLIDNFILTTTIKKEDDIFEKIVKKMGISIYRGYSENVKKRLYLASKKFNIDLIILINGDRPFSDPNIINSALNLYLKKKLSILTTHLKQTFPQGFDVDIFPSKDLLKSFKLSKKKEDWEHVTKIFFDHPKKFKLYNLIAPKKYLLPKLSFLLDYKKDYIKIKKLLSIAHKDNFNEQIGCEDIIKIVKNNPNFF